MPQGRGVVDTFGVVGVAGGVVVVENVNVRHRRLLRHRTERVLLLWFRVGRLVAVLDVDVDDLWLRRHCIRVATDGHVWCT